MKKNFTLMEIVIVVTVIGIIAILGLAMYDKMIEDARARVCETHTDTILGALEIYVLEKDHIPGSISQLTPDQIQKAYAKVMQKPEAWKIRLAYWFLKVDSRGSVFANEPAIPCTTTTTTDNTIKGSNIIKNDEVFTCPYANPNDNAYALSGDFTTNVTDAASFRAYNNDDIPIVADSTARHKHGIINPVYYAVGSSKNCFLKTGGVSEKRHKGKRGGCM